MTEIRKEEEVIFIKFNVKEGFVMKIDIVYLQLYDKNNNEPFLQKSEGNTKKRN